MAILAGNSTASGIGTLTGDAYRVYYGSSAAAGAGALTGNGITYHTGIMTEAQRLASDSLVHMFMLDTTDIGGTEILRWTPGSLSGPSLPQQINNPCCYASTTGWTLTNSFGGSPVLIRAATIGNKDHLNDYGGGYIYYTGTLDGTETITNSYTPINCTTSYYYEFHALVQARNCRVTAQITWRNGANAEISTISSSYTERNTVPSKANAESDYTQLWVIGQAPANAVTYICRLLIEPYGGTGGTSVDPSVIWTKSYSGLAKEGQVQPMPYVPPSGTDRVVFQGNTYEPVPVQITGFEWRGRGPSPRPKVQVANVGGLLTGLLVEYGDLVGAKVTRIRTFRKFLDDQPTADPTQYFDPDIWRVERKTAHNSQAVEWELASVIDQEGRKLPNRAMLRDICTHTYRRLNAAGTAFDYDGVSCPYVGTTYFTETDQPTTDMQNDKCSKYLNGCILRFGQTGVLPTRAFPGMDRYR
jgi:lambda family phage minor tail protein L